MNKIKLLSIVIGAYALFGCATKTTTTAPASGTTPVTTTSKIAQVESTLLTVANVIQQVNSGLLAAAPTVESILTLTHNQGDSTQIAGLANNDAVISAGVSTLLSNVQNAITASQAINAPPAAQQAAISAAITPAAVAAIVAPIAAVTTN